jgi:hypothetical protein
MFKICGGKNFRPVFLTKSSLIPCGLNCGSKISLKKGKSSFFYVDFEKMGRTGLRSLKSAPNTCFRYRQIAPIKISWLPFTSQAVLFHTKFMHTVSYKCAKLQPKTRARLLGILISVSLTRDFSRFCTTKTNYICS